MKTSLRLLALLAFVVLMAPHPVRADVANEAVVEKVVRLLEEFAGIVDQNKSNCDAMGDKLGKFIDANGQFFKDIKAAADKLTPAEKRAIEAKYKARVEAATSKMQDGLTKCMTNPKVASAIEKVK